MHVRCQSAFVFAKACARPPPPPRACPLALAQSPIELGSAPSPEKCVAPQKPHASSRNSTAPELITPQPVWSAQEAQFTVYQPYGGGGHYPPGLESLMCAHSIIATSRGQLLAGQKYQCCSSRRKTPLVALQAGLHAHPWHEPLPSHPQGQLIGPPLHDTPLLHFAAGTGAAGSLLLPLCTP